MNDNTEVRGDCCCPPEATVTSSPDRFTDCMICGKPLVYTEKAERHTCALCGKEFDANCACEKGHYVCDQCHERGAVTFFLPFLLESEEKDPITLLEKMMALPGVHMHGPEHHVIVPCVLLTAYHNCGGGEIDLKAALDEAVRRASKVPGGTCGYWGACGAAIGAGIYMSIVLGSNPLHREAWPIPQMLVAASLEELIRYGGPRCCKRASRTVIGCAVSFTKETLGLEMPASTVQCGYFMKNRECIYRDCPYFPKTRH